jgi:hypothetical protein
MKFFYKIWCRRYATLQTHALLFPTIGNTRVTDAEIRVLGSAISHDPLCIFLTNVTQLNVTWPFHKCYPSVRSSWLENGWSDFHEIWYECYEFGYRSKRIRFICSHLIIPTWRMLKVVRWHDDDTITHDPLLMQLKPDRTQPPHNCCLYANRVS